jgi:hypothetical protein
MPRFELHDVKGTSSLVMSDEVGSNGHPEMGDVRGFDLDAGERGGRKSQNGIDVRLDRLFHLGVLRLD